MKTNPFLTAVYAAGGSPLGKEHIKRKQAADTVADAREKAKALVRENRNWFQYALGPQPKSLLYKREGQFYTLHIKYANRKLKGWCDDGLDEYEGLRHEDMLQMFDSLVWSIDNGECDAAFQVIIDDIAIMRKSKNA